MHHTHSRHLSVGTQASANPESTHCNRVGWAGETLMATYKAVMRPALEYASSEWSPIASSTSIKKLQVMQDAALELPQDARKTQAYSICIALHSHLQLHTSQYKRKAQHPLRKHTTYFNTPGLKEPTIF